MVTNCLSSHGGYRYRAPCQDQKRPNILLSSDIPYKIAQCVSELKANNAGFSSGLEDLSKHIESFDLTLELNSVILRNVNITISKLLDKNQIFVARSKKMQASIIINEGKFKFPEVWKSVLSMRSRDEIFVVNSRLDVKLFTVNLDPPHEIVLEFEDNEDLSSLLAYDKGILEHLKAYISHLLLAELKHQIVPLMSSPEVVNPPQQSSPTDHIGTFNYLLLQNSTGVTELADCSLDGVNSSFEKSFGDTDDVHYSLEDLRILSSSDSGKFTFDEDSGLNSPLVNTECFLASEFADEDKLVSKVQGIRGITGSSEATLHLEYEPNPLESPISIERKEAVIKKDDFVSDIDNLGHSGPEFDSEDSHSQNLKAEKPFDINESFECDAYVDDIPPLSPRKKESASVSPRKALSRTASIHKQSSFSFIDHDDGHGLNYAFKDTSVPEYIKENKKFKFIKIGKVQKFVSMFEEKTEPASANASRIGTRPSSPRRDP